MPCSSGRFFIWFTKPVYGDYVYVPYSKSLAVRGAKDFTYIRGVNEEDIRAEIVRVMQ